MLLLDVVYTALWVPIDVAFCTAQYGNPASACTQSDLAGGALYTINLVLSFQVRILRADRYYLGTTTECMYDV